MTQADMLPPRPPAQGQQKGQPQGAGAAAPAGLSPREIDAIRQLRVLEERSVNLRKKAQLVDENLLGAESRLRDEIQHVTTELAEIRRRLTDVEEGMRLVEEEMRHAARIGDVRSLEKYLAFWEPFQFVTQEELARRANLLKGPGGRPQERSVPGDTARAR